MLHTLLNCNQHLHIMHFFTTNTVSFRNILVNRQYHFVYYSNALFFSDSSRDKTRHLWSPYNLLLLLQVPHVYKNTFTSGVLPKHSLWKTIPAAIKLCRQHKQHIF